VTGDYVLQLIIVNI